MGGDSGFAFVEGTTSDLAFEACGPTLEAAFAAAGRAFLAATVHGLRVKQTHGGWIVSATLDV